METRPSGQPDNRSYHAFLLRLWREGDGEAWRVILEDVQSGKKQGFAGIQPLIEFIHEKTDTETR
jgi:hypothetical protein